MTGYPLITYINEPGAPGYWLLAEAWYTQTLGSTVYVPEGFRFDLASIPRFLWPLVGPMELSIEAPLLHDYLYRHKGKLPQDSVIPFRSFTRAQADRAFRDLMGEEMVGGTRRWAAYWAVRLFGWLSWRKASGRA